MAACAGTATSLEKANGFSHLGQLPGEAGGDWGWDGLSGVKFAWCRHLPGGTFPGAGDAGGEACATQGPRAILPPKAGTIILPKPGEAHLVRSPCSLPAAWLQGTGKGLGRDPSPASTPGTPSSGSLGLKAPEREMSRACLLVMLGFCTVRGTFTHPSSRATIHSVHAGHAQIKHWGQAALSGLSLIRHLGAHPIQTHLILLMSQGKRWMQLQQQPGKHLRASDCSTELLPPSPAPKFALFSAN